MHLQAQSHDTLNSYVRLFEADQLYECFGGGMIHKRVSVPCGNLLVSN